MKDSASKIDSGSWRLYKVFVFLAFLSSFRPWFLWSVNNYVALLAIFAGFYLKVLHPQMFYKQKDSLWMCLLFLCIILGSLVQGVVSILKDVFVLIPLIFIVLLKTYYKEDLLETIQKYLAIILFISLLGWIIHILGVSTPYINMGLGEGENGDSQYEFENHYIFLVNVTRITDLILPRFSSIFCEPGYLGCLLSLNLFIRRYRFDLTNIIFYIALLFSFSLAGYILLVFGLFFHFWGIFRSHSIGTIAVLVLLVGVLIWAKDVNNGDNMVNKMLFERLEYDSSRGTIAGYDRSSEYHDKWFWNTFIYQNDLWFGQKKSTLGANDVDWKAYIVLHGLLSYFIWLLFLLYPVLNGRNRMSCLVLSLIYLGIFSQTLHMSQSLMYLGVYSLGIYRLKNEGLKS